MKAQNDLDFGMKCIKCMLVISNLMFVFVGIMLVTIGFAITGIYTYFEEFMETYYFNPAILSIVIGFFIFIIAMFGFIGACKESTFLVNTYTFFLVLVLILELSVGIAAYNMRSNIETTLAANMKNAMRYFDLTEYNAFAWNATQYNLQCCGIHNASEWGHYGPWYKLSAIKINDHKILYIPKTCCINMNCTSLTSVYTRGCLYPLSAIISQCAILLTIGTLCVSLIQVLGIAFSHMLAKSIRKLKTQKLVEQEKRRRWFYEQVLRNRDNASKQEIGCTVKESEA